MKKIPKYQWWIGLFVICNLLCLCFRLPAAVLVLTDFIYAVGIKIICLYGKQKSLDLYKENYPDEYVFFKKHLDEFDYEMKESDEAYISFLLGLKSAYKENKGLKEHISDMEYYKSYGSISNGVLVAGVMIQVLIF